MQYSQATTTRNLDTNEFPVTVHALTSFDYDRDRHLANAFPVPVSLYYDSEFTCKWIPSQAVTLTTNPATHGFLVTNKNGRRVFELCPSKSLPLTMTRNLATNGSSETLG